MKSTYTFYLVFILCVIFSNNFQSQIVINEIDVSPTSNDGSFIGYSSSAGGSGQGEWIELYNPTCNPIDISGYIVSTFNSTDGDGMSYIIPSGKIVPAKGFAVLRGANKTAPPAGVIDIKVDDLTANKYCIENPGNPSEPRMWFSNAGSWIGLYSKTGTVVDMIKWGTPNVPSDLSGNPCIPSSSTIPGSTTLASFNSYGAGAAITSSATAGKTFVRIPDGGTWSQTAVNETTSYGARNQALPTAVITYSGSPWCTTAAVKNVTLTGTGTYTGGTYTSTTGLSINSSTGAITVTTSTPGTYTITYTLTGITCPDYFVTTSVTIDDISATAVKTDPTCTGATANTDGTITITASGGDGSYTYSKDSGTTFGASATFNALAANTYTLKAKDAAGCIATVSPNLTLSVTCAPCVPPTITGQPTAATACVGANATFTVTANGSTTGYQWQVNTGSGFADIAGETNATLTLTSVTAGMNGNQYHCVVKEGTASCPTTSSNVILTVDNITATATKTDPTCSGATPNTDGTITITTTNGTGPYTYSSDNGVLFANANPITGLASNTYIVKAKDANGCIATVSPNVTLSVTCPAAPCIAPTIVTQPVATSGCVNSTAVFNVVAGGTVSGYKWQAYNIATGWLDIPGATSSTLNLPGLLIAANGSKVHCILQESSGNCPDTTNDVILTVDDLPTSLSTGSLTVCSTNPGTVTGVSASNGLISWSHNGSGSLSGGTTLTPTYTPGGSDVNSTVVLTMTVTSNNSCNPATSQANFSIKVDPAPTALAGGSLTICSNGTATVGGASATNGTILWTHNGAGSLTNQTTDTPTYTANALDAGKAIVLTMNVTSSTSCPNPTPATFTVNVDPLPTATAGGSTTICSNSTATVSGATSSNGGILWTHNGSGTLSNATTLTPTYTPVVADENNTVSLTLTVTSTNSCSTSPAATANYTIIVTPVLTPTATAGGSSTICMTKTATISGATATNGTIVWTHNGGGNLNNATTLTPTYTSVKADTLAPVILTLTVTPNGTCSSLIPTDTYTISVKSNPIVTPTSTLPCVGNNLQLSANTVVNGQYAWTGPNGFTNSNQTASITSVTLLDAGVYNLQIIDENNCVNTASITVNVNPNPIITVDTLVCVGNKVLFSANTTPSVTPWSSQTSNLLSINSSTGEATGVLGGKATVSYTDLNSCTSTKTITVEDLPIVNFTVDSTSICLGNDVEFTDKSPKKNSNLVWDFGDGTTSTDLVPTHTYLKVDSFSVKLTSTSPAGCTNSSIRTKYITPIDVPTINFSFSPDSIQIYLPEVKFTNLSNAQFYTWIFGDYSPVSNVTSPKHTFPDTPGQAYSVTLKGSNSLSGLCPAYKTQQIMSVDPAVFFIPNSFTPNSDEINNTFQPVFTSGYDPQNYALWIYNRWGQLVFESHNSAIGWDGTYAGKMGENSTYVWKLQFKAKQTEKEYYRTGTVNLIK
jgi:gliding motility-associated-like protein